MRQFWLVFLAGALIAGAFAFSGIATAAAAATSRLLFIIFLVLALVGLLTDIFRRS